MLYYIKTMLGVGTVYVEKGNNIARFRLRNVNNIAKYLIPIFEKYPLLTSKYKNYLLFSQAVNILLNKNLSSSEKHNELLVLQNQKMISDTSPR